MNTFKRMLHVHTFYFTLIYSGNKLKTSRQKYEMIGMKILQIKDRPHRHMVEVKLPVG